MWRNFLIILSTGTKGISRYVGCQTECDEAAAVYFNI